MLTTSAMMFEVIQGVDLPYNPMFFLAVGFGALRTWTLAAFAAAIFGFIEVCLFSVPLPMK